MGSDFKAGYQKAVDDLCKRYDRLHKKYLELWNDGNANSDTAYRLGRELIALNAAIYELETNMRVIVY